MMKGNLQDVLFDWWCSGRTDDLPEIKEGTCSVGKYFGTSAAGEVFIENLIIRAVQAAERNAFLGGLNLGTRFPEGIWLKK